MTRAEASKILGKDYDRINRYKKTVESDMGDNLIKGKWYDRIGLVNDNPYLFEDTRLQKAAYYLASATLGSNINFSVTNRNNLNVEQGINILSNYFKNDKLTKLISLNKDEISVTADIIRKIGRESISPTNEVEHMVFENVVASLETEDKYRRYIFDLFNDIDILTLSFNDLKQAILVGDATSEIIYDNNGILDVIPINWKRVLPQYTKMGVFSKWLVSRNTSANQIEYVGLKPVRVLHTQFSLNDYMGYGLFLLTKNINFYTHMVEKLLIEARKSRSVQTRVHKPNYNAIPENLMGSLNGLVNEKDAREHLNKFLQVNRKGELFRDVALNGIWDLEILETNGDVFNYTKDIEYMNELLKIGLLIPVGILDSGSSVNRNTIEIQNKFLKGIVNLLERQIIKNVKHLIRLELYLKGEDLDNVDVEVTLDGTGLVDLKEGADIIYKLRSKYIKYPYSLTAKWVGFKPEQLAKAVITDHTMGLDQMSPPEDTNTVDDEVTNIGGNNEPEENSGEKE